ncbi:hypothetical protein STEG23_029073 [Scotinomys teguina]
MLDNSKDGALTENILTPLAMTQFLNLLSRLRWQRSPVIPALERQRKADLCEFEASLVYKEQSGYACVPVTSLFRACIGRGSVERRRRCVSFERREL